jgi:hypothetical protein
MVGGMHISSRCLHVRASQAARLDRALLGLTAARDSAVQSAAAGAVRREGAGARVRRDARASTDTDTGTIAALLREPAAGTKRAGAVADAGLARAEHEALVRDPAERPGVVETEDGLGEDVEDCEKRELGARARGSASADVLP